MSGDKPVKLAILWHMHQPNYQQPNSSKMVLPWVRLHAVKDYLDMVLIASKYDNIKVTFNLVPSLLDQIELYLQGGTDPHLEMTRIKAEELSDAQRLDILNTFFNAHPQTMIEPYSRFKELYKKTKENYNQDILPALFTSEEMRDIQVWSNLVWVDPIFRVEEPIKSLFKKGRHFTEEEKHQLLNWQLNLLKRIVPTYRELYQEGKIDISFTPYYHPILPLLCDTGIACEAIPSIELPQIHFANPEDARNQIRMSAEKFQTLFNKKMNGMWPSEGSVSEEAVSIMIEEGIEWIATDEEILFHSMKKSQLKPEQHQLYKAYEYGPGLKIFFRDHSLSDRIGFVYSGIDPDEAVDDFVNHVLNIRNSFSDKIDDSVISVILDGENAWEYFPNDGYKFLTRFYQRLNDEPLIETITMTEAARNVKSQPLESLFAGSWINHNFRIWIGHPEDNMAWDLLSKTRNKLVEFEKEHPEFDQQKIADSWKQIYIAEGSDWCWWYGDEHRGDYNEQFDKIFRSHLAAVYENLNLEILSELVNPIYQSKTVIKTIMPDDIITPVIDGRLTHFYEWTGAGFLDCLKAGGAMHRADKHIARIYFAYDHSNLYIRLDLGNKKSAELIRKLRCQLTFFTPDVKNLEFEIGKIEDSGGNEKGYFFALDEILEIAVNRSFIFEKDYGSAGMIVSLFDGNKKIESCPENEPIKIDVPEKGKEMFWPS